MLICKCLGGSHAYGLNTPISDIDYRGVFLNEDVSQIIGLKRLETIDKKIGEFDEVYYELRHFIGMLKRANSSAMELLFNNTWVSISDEFKEVQKNQWQLIDSKQFFNSLRGYMQSERRLAFGNKTGTLGKRKIALETYQFSPKNVVQLLRLAWAGQTFFRKGHFPVDVSESPIIKEYLLEIKTHPENFNVDVLKLTIDNAEEQLIKAFESRKITYEFSEDVANRIIYDIYMPILSKNH